MISFQPSPTVGGGFVNLGTDPTIRTTTTTTEPEPVVEYPPGVSYRNVNGIELHLQADELPRLALSITNRTKAPIGYLTNEETRFWITDLRQNELWNDNRCRATVGSTTPTGYLEIPPGEAITVADYYPTPPGTRSDGCTARSGDALVHAAVTLCRNLDADWRCTGTPERPEAQPVYMRL